MSRPPKRRRISEQGSENRPNGVHAKSTDAGEWNAEQAYEQLPRRLKTKAATRLPIKSAEGWIEQAVNEHEDVLDSDHTSFTSDETVEDEQSTLSVIDPPLVLSRQQVLEAKENMARYAALLAEDPENNVGALRELAEYAASSNSTVKKLALATQGAVYRDLIPGYRIRPMSEENGKEKLSKDVRTLRMYEQGMVKSYQIYVQQLDTIAKKSDTPEAATCSTVALSCACMLLVERPHFNFRTNLLAILIRRLSRKTIDADYDKCIDTLQTLFRSDDEGHTSLDAVNAIAKMLKARNFNVNEPVLNTFLHLRLLSEFSGTASHTRVDKDHDRSMKTAEGKNKKPFLTKKEKKHSRELKKVQKEMKEADATVSREDRDRIQGEILKIVFATYFRILKLETSMLKGATLEGLAKFAHLINQDFFGDIVECLKELLQKSSDSEVQEEGEAVDGQVTDAQESRNMTREILLCVITAFALLQGQHGRAVGSTLNLDLEFFVSRLYRSLHATAMDADLELSASSLHLPDPNAEQQYALIRRKVNMQTTTVLLIRSLSAVLLPAAALRAVPPVRLAAFIKQLFTVSLQLPEKSCLAMLGLLDRVTKLHARRVSGLWRSEERRGEGAFDPFKEEIEGTNPFASTVWEGELLRIHYAPKIRQMHKSVRQNIIAA